MDGSTPDAATVRSAIDSLVAFSERAEALSSSSADATTFEDCRNLASKALTVFNEGIGCVSLG